MIKKKKKNQNVHNQESKIDKTKRNPTIYYNKPIKPNGFCNNLPGAELG